MEDKSKLTFNRSLRHKSKYFNLPEARAVLVSKDIKNKIETEKHYFQIIVEYENGDNYTYNAEEFEKIRYNNGEYILLLKGWIETNEQYEDDLDDDDFVLKYNYDTLAEIELRENDCVKEILMLDTNTGHEYQLTYELVNYFYNLNSKSKEMCNVNIIDVLGEEFIAESIG